MRGLLRNVSVGAVSVLLVLAGVLIALVLAWNVGDGLVATAMLCHITAKQHNLKSHEQTC